MIAVYRELPADLETPVSVYLKLQAGGQSPSFLLESVQYGEQLGRYSFIGLPARTRLQSSGMRTEVVTDGAVTETHDGNPLDFIAAYQQRFKVALRPGLPRFCGGLAGYFGYDSALGSPLVKLGDWVFLWKGGFGLAGTGGPASTAAVLGFFLYMVAFMDTTATIPTGAMAERWKWRSFVGWGLFCGAIYYPLFGAWTWGGGWRASSRRRGPRCSWRYTTSACPTRSAR